LDRLGSPSLPVPVSPWISTVASLRAILSSCENTSAHDRAVAHDLAELRPLGAVERRRARIDVDPQPVAPSARVVPLTSSGLDERRVASSVPFRLPRSRTRTASFTIASSQ